MSTRTPLPPSTPLPVPSRLHEPTSCEDGLGVPLVSLQPSKLKLHFSKTTPLHRHPNIHPMAHAYACSKIHDVEHPVLSPATSLDEHPTVSRRGCMSRNVGPRTVHGAWSNKSARPLSIRFWLWLGLEPFVHCTTGPWSIYRSSQTHQSNY